MTGNKDKLTALEDLLGVDDTADVERPRPTRSISDVLRGGNGQTSGGEPTSEPLAPRDAPESPATVTSSGQSSQPPSKRRATEPAQRTSATLPSDLVGRLKQASDRRWSLSELVAAALDRSANVSLEAAELALASTSDDIRVARSYSITADHLEVLDEIGERWRMNRSQVITVVIPPVLDELHL